MFLFPVGGKLWKLENITIHKKILETISEQEIYAFHIQDLENMTKTCFF